MDWLAREQGGGTRLVVLFALTLFLSAFLLFLVQPMIAKMILPSLGGTPAVWNTCQVFFQAILLAGYTYAHAATGWLGVRRQSWLHAAVILLPFVVLPLSLHDWMPPAGSNPIGWLLALLLVSVGLPFFVLSTTAPLLQKWFTETGHPMAAEPYFLYAASNLGSMLALIGYPTLVEPYLPMRGTGALMSQVNLWTVGYALLCLLLFACHTALHGSRPTAARFSASKPAAYVDPAPSRAVRLRWIALAFVPSSLMLGITTYITMDIAAIPLLWVLPLSLYLLSFVIVFGWLAGLVSQGRDYRHADSGAGHSLPCRSADGPAKPRPGRVENGGAHPGYRAAAPGALRGGPHVSRRAGKDQAACRQAHRVLLAHVAGGSSGRTI